jgi:SAM-dependent methyltransferase
MPRLYEDLAPWWPLLSDPDEYREEAFLYECTLRDAVEGELRSVMEMGCGGANTIGYFDESLDLCLVDSSQTMLDVAKERVPRALCLLGDMRDLRLNERFDGVFLHDAVAYMTTEEELLAALKTVAHHLRPGGAALVVPDAITEQFGPSTEHGGRDGEGRSARYLCWTTDPDPTDTEVLATMTYVLREDGADDEVVHEVHRWGLFPRATWLRVFEAAGLVAEERVVDPDVHDPRYGNVMFVATHP